MGRGSSTTEQKGFGINDPELTKEMFDEVVPRVQADVARRDVLRYDGKFFSMPPRNVLPKPYTRAAPADVGRGRQPGHVREGRAAWASASSASPRASPEALAPLIEVYKKDIENAEPVGEYVNNNVMVTSQMLCLEDGQKARDIASNMTTRLPEQPGVPVPRHVPEARGRPRLARA